METAHDFNVQGLERVAGRLNKVNAGVNPVVDNIHPVDFIFSLQVGIKPLFNVFHNGSPRIVVVDKIAKPGGIHNRQAQANPIFFDISTD